MKFALKLENTDKRIAASDESPVHRQLADQDFISLISLASQIL